MKLTAGKRFKALALAPAFGIIGDTQTARMALTASITGRWEGGERDRQRSRPGRALESVDWGLNYGVRESMLSEARALEQTFAICRKINRTYARHVVGSCRMKWNTGDSAIDKIYGQSWVDYMPLADLRGRNTYQKLTKIAVARILVDGRIFGQHDRRNSFLQIAPIEGDRVSSDGIFNADRPGLVSGVGIDANGRMKFVKVWERTLYGQFQNPQEIPAEQMIHVFDSDRFDSVSGHTHYHAVLNTVRDLAEVVKAERLSAKRNSKLALLQKVLGGSAEGVVDLFGEDGEKKSPNDPTIKVQSIGDVADAFMYPGEEVKAHTSDRPSQGWLSLMEWLVREIATGLDLPFGVVWHMAGLGKPAILFDISQANRTFREFLSDVIEPMWHRRNVGAWLTTEINAGRLPFTPYWYRFAVPRPKSITIDMGRDSKAGIAENLAGLGTATDWYAEEDQDFEEKTAQLVYEARVRECLRLGIDFNPKLKVPLEQIRTISANPQSSGDTAKGSGGDAGADDGED